MQPHRGRYWLNANPLDPAASRAQSEAVCDLYERAGLLAERGIHVVSTDEKTGIQALERKHPDIPMGPGRVQGREHEYIRHGTLCLTADLEIWCGCIIAPTLGPTRAEGDFAAHIEQTVATDPFAGWVFIADTLNTHQSESLAGPPHYEVLTSQEVRAKLGLPVVFPERWPDIVILDVDRLTSGWCFGCSTTGPLSSLIASRWPIG